jgi:hypothetical protein
MVDSSDGALFQAKRLKKETGVALTKRLDALPDREYRLYLEKLKHYLGCGDLTASQRARLKDYIRRAESVANGSD